MYSWPLNFDEIPGSYLGKRYIVIMLRVVDFLCKYNRQRRGVEENDLILFRRGSGGGLADVTNVFFSFLTKRISPFLQKTRDVEVKLVKCWECKGEGLASFGNSNSYCVYSYGN